MKKSPLIASLLVLIIIVSFGYVFKSLTPDEKVAQVVTSTSICEAAAGAHCYYVAPNGSDSNPGTFDAPFKTFKPAVTAVAPGDFIYARGGTYTAANDMMYSSDYNSTDQMAMVAIADYWGSTIPKYSVASGTAGHSITLKAYPGETPIFQGSTSGTIDGTSDIMMQDQLMVRSYWVIEGFEIVNGEIEIPGGKGFGQETHDITIQNNYLHNFVIDTAGNNPGMIRIDRADQSGAYNIFIRNNHLKNASLTANPGVWTGVGHMLGGITVLSETAYSPLGTAAGGTGYIEITNNEFEQLPAVVYFKNPMVGPIEMHGNIIHDSDMLGLLDASNMHFNHNLVYNVGEGFYQVGIQENPAPGVDGVSGQKAIVQHNTFVGLYSLMSISQGMGHLITNNVFFGLPDRTSTAGWDTGGAYLTQDATDADPLDAVSMILKTITSNNNCFITPHSDMIFVSRYYTDGTPLEFDDFPTGQRLYGFDLNSKLIIQSDPTKIFANPAANNYSLLDPTICPQMGVSLSDISNVGPAYVPPPTSVPPPPPTLSLSSSPSTLSSGQSATLSWSSQNTTSCTASNGWSGTLATSGTQVVTPLTTTTYALSCTGSGGTTAQTTTVTVSGTTPPPPTPSQDTTPPSTPSNVAAPIVNSNDVTLSWSQSTDNVGVVGYNLYRNGTLLNFLTGTSYLDSTVQAGITYTYTVSALDAAGNQSPQSPGVTITTPALPSTPPPVPPTTNKFNIGDWVSVNTDKLNIRSTPGGQKIGTQTYGAKGQVIAGPTSQGGLTWWDVNFTSGTTGFAAQGWATETYLDLSTPPIPLAIGNSVITTEALTVRALPTSSSARLGRQGTGSTGIITSGPVQADGYTWWQVNFTSGQDGWVVNSLR